MRKKDLMVALALSWFLTLLFIACLKEGRWILFFFSFFVLGGSPMNLETWARRVDVLDAYLVYTGALAGVVC